MKWIDLMIDRLWEKYGTTDPNVILHDLNILVWRVDMNNPMLLGKNCMYYVDLKIIYIRDDLILSCELFYLSHELGHRLLHYEYDSKYLSCIGKFELQANYFAFRFRKIKFNRFELLHMTLEQFCCELELPFDAIKQIIHLIFILPQLIQNDAFSNLFTLSSNVTS